MGDTMADIQKISIFCAIDKVDIDSMESMNYLMIETSDLKSLAYCYYDSKVEIVSC